MNREDKWLCQIVKKKKSKNEDNPCQIHRLNPDNGTILLNKEYYNWAVGVYRDMSRNNCMFTQEVMYLMCLCGALMFNGDNDE